VITRRDKAIAYIICAERMVAIETLEIWRILRH
jgi:hypothetical protein